jgi:hypothetical protein
MITTILFACSILAVSILTWLFRRRFTKYLPGKETVSTFSFVAPVALLLCVAISPDVLLLISAITYMPPLLKTVIGLAAAAAIVYTGCSKKAETPKQPAIQWTSPETGFHAETPPEPKEGK